MENFYLDNAATTKCFDEEIEIFKELSVYNFYNPSASYRPAREIKKQLDQARLNIVDCVGGEGGKLYFTSSATESNNTVFKGVNLRAGDIVLISKGEHPSVYESAHDLEKRGVKVFEIAITSNGVVDEDDYKKLVCQDGVKFISIIHSSNEIGAINDISKLCKIAKSVNKNIIFHSDGVQALGKINVNLNSLGVDLYTISAHKIYAPRGIAGLWVKNGVHLNPLLLGGGQEDGFRSSTENVSGALMFSYAVKKVCSERLKNFEIVKEYKKQFLNKLNASSVSDLIKINSPDDANPYVVSLSIKGIKGEVLVNLLETYGVFVSTGSACSAKKAGNRVLEAMGFSKDEVISSIRVSFSPYIEYDFDKIATVFEECIKRLKI